MGGHMEVTLQITLPKKQVNILFSYFLFLINYSSNRSERKKENVQKYKESRKAVYTTNFGFIFETVLSWIILKF